MTDLAGLIYKVFSMTFLIVGTASNTMAAVVYSQKRMRKSSYAFYLFALAVADLSVTLVGNLRILLMFYDFGVSGGKHDMHGDQNASSSTLQTAAGSAWQIEGFDIRETSLVACRIHIFLTYYFLQLSSVILCFLNIDRLFGCVLVLKSSKFCQPNVGK